MTRYLLLLLIILPCMLTAQLEPRAPQQYPHERRRNFNDSVVFYKYVLKRMQSDARHEVMMSTTYKAIEDTLTAVRSRSQNYIGMSVFFEAVYFNPDGLNQRLTSIGFPQINSYSPRFGIGITDKKKRRMFDLQLLIIGIPNKSTKGADNIKTSMHNYLQFTWGYDLLNSRRWSIYPYGGLGRRKSQLKYNTPITYTPGHPEINEIIANNRSVKFQVDRLVYLAGIEVDFRTASESTGATNIVFLRTGMNRTFRKEYYSITEEQYSTGIKTVIWFAAIGMKFAGRK